MEALSGFSAAASRCAMPQDKQSGWRGRRPTSRKLRSPTRSPACRIAFYLIDRLECALEAAREEAVSCAVLFLDLDRFKLVNDSLGHAAGDELLLEVSRRVRSAVLADDTGRASGRSVVARLGGDEFAVLLTHVQEQAEAAVVAERILKGLNPPFRLNGRQVFASLSVGIAIGSGTETPEDLLRNSDTAMYWAKTRGKGRYEVFDETMRERAIARLEIETDLRGAIDAGHLCLFYQPEFSVQTRQVIGYEALVRWNHPERGLLSPGEFIPVAEESDLIITVGQWVLAHACRQMAEWQKEFLFDPPLSISVNVSPRQLHDPGFVDAVASVLHQTGLNPRSLKLEMTESSIISNPEVAIAMLSQLKEMHVGLEIDDFGTGYSSLSVTCSGCRLTH
jgi:diguanylate cyclase (GGDEF)-like protein